LFVILYTALAGMISVAYTDVVNGLLMMAGFAVAVPVLWTRVDALGGAAALLSPERMRWVGTVPVAEAVALTLPAFLLVLGDANMYQRFFSARSPAAAARGVRWLVPAVLLMELVIIACAWLGGGLTGPLDNPGHVLAFVARDHLPALLGALLLATILAIIVSTADSYLLVPATCLVRDVWERFVRPGASETELVRVSRATVLLLGALAWGLTHVSDRFLAVALWAYTMYGAGITPSLVAAFVWPRATSPGAVASIATGILVTIGWEVVGKRWLPAVDTVYAALGLSVAALVVVSLVTTATPDRTLR
ncbi:MAG TPA: sodium:solute symporter family protein, partial [bacterium]|nr:sodium:solute symporter family protein [bacterium]